MRYRIMPRPHPNKHFLTPLLLAGALGIFGASAHGQSGAPTPWPFASKPGASPSPAGSPSTLFGATKPDEGPRDTPLVEKKWEELSNRDLGKDGKTAISIQPEKWKHAETDNFILHYRRVTEAQKVAREVEYDLWFVAKTLRATKDRYQRKSHVFVFKDEDEWRIFLSQTAAPPWAASFAYGDELFLNVRGMDTGIFNSNTLAHETTHAVVARLFPNKRWPLWLNEGWAEYMGGASVAARKGQTVKAFQSRLHMADLPLSTMEGMKQYPDDPVQVAQLYQTAEKLVRFLMDQMPRERITQFIDAELNGKSLEASVTEIYGDKIKDWADFQKRYERFAK
jgi:hypothetical protein